jgi:hypothetical protein
MDSMSHDPVNDEVQLREELVSYLDGELDAEQSRRIEQRAAAEPGARRMLEELDRTWHMLDALDAPATGEDFTRTTLEMVALAAAEDVQKAKDAAPRKRRRARLWAAAGLLAAAAAGFLIVAGLAPDPNAQLLQDLPFLENFDQYREIDSIDFLRAVNDEKLFAEDAAPATGPGAVETLSQRRRQVQAMSAEQRDDLFRSEQQFHALPPQDQQRIRDLHDQIDSAADREMLRATLNRYCKWIEAQPPFRRAKLLDRKKTLKENIATIKEFLAKQSPTKDLRLDDRSRRALAAWLDHYIAEHGIESLSQGPHAGNPRFLLEKQQIAKLPPDRQQVIIREILLRRWQMGGTSGQMPISAHEMAGLRAGLSPELRAKLEAKTPADQTRIIAAWLRETASHELDEQLVDFFEKTISDAERDRLMSLPSDEMYESLSKQYRAYMLKPSKSAEPPRGERPAWQHGHRPGSPRGSGARRWTGNRDEEDPL